MPNQDDHDHESELTDEELEEVVGGLGAVRPGLRDRRQVEYGAPVRGIDPLTQLVYGSTP